MSDYKEKIISIELNVDATCDSPLFDGLGERVIESLPQGLREQARKYYDHLMHVADICESMRDKEWEAACGFELSGVLRSLVSTITFSHSKMWDEAHDDVDSVWDEEMMPWTNLHIDEFDGEGDIHEYWDEEKGVGLPRIGNHTET